MKQIWMCVGLGILLAFPVVAKDTMNPKLESLWMGLPQSQSQCTDYDYFPDGGMRNFWCHISGELSLSTLEEMTGESVFKSGPHNTSLQLNDAKSFGHYNPKFVVKLTKLVIPSASDSSFVASTQSVYDSHVRPLARIHYATLQKLKQNPECAQKELTQYQGAIAHGAVTEVNSAIGSYQVGYYERWFYFMNPKFCSTSNPDSLFDDGFDGGYDGNVVKTATGFWLRRSMDGTQGHFADALEQLLQRYDAVWLKKQSSSTFK